MGEVQAALSPPGDAGHNATARAITPAETPRCPAIPALAGGSWGGGPGRQGWGTQGSSPLWGWGACLGPGQSDRAQRPEGSPLGLQGTCDARPEPQFFLLLSVSRPKTTREKQIWN